MSPLTPPTLSNIKEEAERLREEGICQSYRVMSDPKMEARGR
jgi:hypothetical protein